MLTPDGSQGYTWNPITGCLNGCPYCYARRLANGRLRQRYLANKNIAPISGTYYERHYGEVSQNVASKAMDDPFYPRFWPERLSSPYSVMRPNKRGFVYYEQKPKGIFVCDMGELFGDWVPGHWQAQIFQTISDNTQHRFYLLTKQPQNLSKSAFFGNANADIGRSANFDSGSFSRYFDIDKWFNKTFPFFITPKASKSEKNKGLDYSPHPIMGRDEGQDIRNVPHKASSTPRINQHPTIKPLKLMSYLITLGSREGDVILDPFLGSGTTCLAAKMLNRKCIGIDIKKGYCEIAARRCVQTIMDFRSVG